MMCYNDCDSCANNCNYNASDDEVEALWFQMQEIPFQTVPSAEAVLAIDWQGWKKGTTKQVLFDWFDEHHSMGVTWLKENTDCVVRRMPKDLRRFVRHCLDDSQFWDLGGIPSREKEFIENLSLNEEQLCTFYAALQALRVLAKSLQND
jgi:hypothetical protein